MAEEDGGGVGMPDDRDWLFDSPAAILRHVYAERAADPEQPWSAMGFHHDPAIPASMIASRAFTGLVFSFPDRSSLIVPWDVVRTIRAMAPLPEMEAGDDGGEGAPPDLLPSPHE